MNKSDASKDFYLLDENMFFSVVPFWAIDQQNMELVPELTEQPLLYGTMIDPATFDFENPDLENLDPETWEVMYDDEGNPVFLQYGYIPADEMTFGSRNTYAVSGGLTQPIYLGGKSGGNTRFQKLPKRFKKTAKTKAKWNTR